MIPAFHPVQTRQAPNRLPASVVLRAYEVYCDLWGEQPAMINDDCRCGFGLHELLAMLYARSFPRVEWRKRFNEALETPLRPRLMLDVVGAPKEKSDAR